MTTPLFRQIRRLDPARSVAESPPTAVDPALTAILTSPRFPAVAGTVVAVPSRFLGRYSPRTLAMAGASTAAVLATGVVVAAVVVSVMAGGDGDDGGGVVVAEPTVSLTSSPAPGTTPDQAPDATPDVGPSGQATGPAEASSTPDRSATGSTPTAATSRTPSGRQTATASAAPPPVVTAPSTPSSAASTPATGSTPSVSATTAAPTAPSSPCVGTCLNGGQGQGQVTDPGGPAPSPSTSPPPVSPPSTPVPTPDPTTPEPRVGGITVARTAPWWGWVDQNGPEPGWPDPNIPPPWEYGVWPPGLGLGASIAEGRSDPDVAAISVIGENGVYYTASISAGWWWVAAPGPWEASPGWHWIESVVVIYGDGNTWTSPIGNVPSQ